MKYKLFCKLCIWKHQLYYYGFHWLSDKVEDLEYSRYFKKEWDKYNK